MENEVVKVKRGRKSKKDILNSLNSIKTDCQTINSNNVDITVKELPVTEESIIEHLNNDNDHDNDIDNDNDKHDNIIFDENQNSLNSNKTFSKKRGRKPKGGKIIQQTTTINAQKDTKPNIILHLKCSLKDLNNECDNNIESFNFSSSKDLTYNMLHTNNSNESTSINKINYNANANINETDNDFDPISKDSVKELYRKIKQLEQNLHINNVDDKKSACFWCTYEFDNPPIYIPKNFIKESYNVYGCFCSPECAVAYLMEENIDSSTKFERYHFINHLYAKIYNYKKNIKPAPNPYYMLDKYYGNLSIQEYRSLFKNERLFLIVDKPLTRILPELHEDNDEFILNNKIIPSNNYQIKKKIQSKSQNKNTILNEKFGISQ
jgi:hypothetical protein